MDFDSQKECLEFEGRLLEAKQWKTRLFVARQCSHCSGCSQLKVYKKGKLKKTINLDECYGIESDDGQYHDCLNELENHNGATTVARQASLSRRSFRKESPFNCQKPKIESSLSLDNEINDVFSGESNGCLIRMHSDSLLGSPPPKMCHRCFQHKYINQAFVDSLEFYDNCKFTRNYDVARWKSSETVCGENQVRLDQLCHDEGHHFSSKRSATRKFMPHLFLPRRLKRTTVNEKRTIQDRSNEEEILNNWPAQCSDSKSTTVLVANNVDVKEEEQETEECKNASQKRRFASLNVFPSNEESNQSPVMSLAAVDFNHISNRHQCSQVKNLPISASSVSPIGCTENAPATSSSSQSTCAKLWETKLNNSITQHRLRATLSSHIRGSFSCYDGDCPDEVPMVFSAIVPQERSPALSKPDCLLKAPLSAPCLPQNTTVFDFPCSKVADYREIVIRDGKVVKSKSSSLPCHGSRQRKLSNYVHIDMVATQAARKIATQRAEEFTGLSLPASVLSCCEDTLISKKSNAGSLLAIADFPS